MICDVSAMRITFNKKDHLDVLGIYRPPTAAVDQSLRIINDVLDKINPQKGSIFITGYININNLIESSDRTALSELLASYNIRRLELPPTRITTSSATSIDIVCTNIGTAEVSVEVLNTDLSDHMGQYCTLQIKDAFTSLGNKISYSNHRNFNYNKLEKIRQNLVTQNWERVLQSTCADEAYNSFVDILTATMDHVCPPKKTRINYNRKTKPWYDKEAGDLRMNFLRAHETYILSGKEDDKQRPFLIKKRYDQKLKMLRHEANADLINRADNKSKAIWDVINSERKTTDKQCTDIPFITVAGEKIKDPHKIAASFNKYFSTIAEETLKNVQSGAQVRNIQPLNFETVLDSFPLSTSKDVKKIISSIKNKSSTGLDGISSKMIKHGKSELIIPILHIANTSLQTGQFPTNMKSAKVIPLHKKGRKDDINNYRPISLLSSVSKILEKIVLVTLLKHLEINNLLTKSQHGFRKGKSTTTAIVDLLEYILDNLEEGNIITSIFVDLSKAFDCLSHELILAKLESLGVRGIALRWFESYLMGRSQLVEIKQSDRGLMCNTRSELLPMTRGVPQGSVLGPVLFALFTNDLPAFIEDYSNAIMYADDTVLLTAKKFLEQLEINAYIGMNVALEYCNNNDLVLNEQKTKQMSFGRKKENISDIPGLQSVEEFKYLGVTIDADLTWQSHIDALCSKLSSALFAIRRTKTISTKEATRTAYHALFESHVRYGITVWGASANNHLERVLVLQKKALRIMADLKGHESCREVFREWRIMTVINVYILEVTVLAISKNLQRNSDQHHYNTRYAENFSLPVHTKKLSEKKPSYTGAKFYNILLENIKSNNPRILKNLLQTWLLERSIYTVNEFLNWERLE